MDDSNNGVTATNVDQFEPSLWHFIGQHKAVYTLQACVNQFFNDRMEGRCSKYPVVLLSGTKGSGRRTIAYCLHRAVGNLEFREAAFILGLSQDPAEFFDNLSEHTTFYIPNFHQVSPTVAGIIASLVKDRVYHVSSPFRKDQTIHFDDQLIILSTESSPLNPALLRYIDVHCGLTEYSNEHILKILKQRIDYLNWVASENALQAVVKAAQGNPGRAMALLQYCYILTRAENKDKISISEAQKAVVLVT